MTKVNVRVIGRSFRGTGAGKVIAVSRRDANVLSRLGRVEIIPPADDVDFTPSEKLDEQVVRPAKVLRTPEADLATVAHVEDEPKPKKRSRRKKKGA